MRRFRRRVWSRRRSVSWIPGLTGFDPATPAQSTLVTFQAGLDANTKIAPFALVSSTDITDVGGEDCVLTRISYELCFYNGRKATDQQAALAVRMLVVLSEVHTGGVSPQILGEPYLTSSGLGRDNILHTRDFVVPTANGYEASGVLAETFLSSNWIRGEVKARRKVNQGLLPMLWFSSCSDGANVPQDFRMLGHLRILMKRPR